MSRRLLLAGSSTSDTPPTDPGDGGGPGGGDGFPATTDPVLLALRPTGVRNLATGTGSPGTNVGDNLVTLVNVMDAATESAYGMIGPDHSGILFLPPGEYSAGMGIGRWFAIVGTTGNPEDVIIYSDTIAGDGVIHPYSPVYIEGVTLKGGHNAALDQSPKYAAHIAGSPRVTFANVIFDMSDAHATSAADSTWGCAGTVGMDGQPGTVLTFYTCTFLDVTGDSRLGMNLHGGPLGTYPSRISFINCTAPKGVGYSYGASSGPANVDDEMYVIGGTIGGPIQTSDNVHVYTDLPNTIDGASATTRDHTTWPLPTSHGLIDLWNDYYYPSSLDANGTTEVQAVVTDTAPMTPVAGRTYYCPVPITNAVHLNRWGLHVRSGAGADWGWMAAPDPGIYYGSLIPANRVPEELLSPMGTGSALPAGRSSMTYYYSWMLYPATSVGGNRAWFKFKIANTTGVTIDGSAMLPGLHDCWYSDNDGTTLVKATAGTPFPLAHAAQVR